MTACRIAPKIRKLLAKVAIISKPKVGVDITTIGAIVNGIADGGVTDADYAGAIGCKGVIQDCGVPTVEGGIANPGVANAGTVDVTDGVEVVTALR